MWRGKIFSGSRLWNTQLSTDLTKKVTRLEVPVYFLHGVYDYTVSYPLAKSYYEQLDAPLKGFYTFTESAHSPLFEEPKRMREIMQADVLVGANETRRPRVGTRLRLGRRTSAAGSAQLRRGSAVARTAQLRHVGHAYRQTSKHCASSTGPLHPGSFAFLLASSGLVTMTP